MISKRTLASSCGDFLPLLQVRHFLIHGVFRAELAKTGKGSGGGDAMQT
jgi:hypothetical protein